MRSAGIALQQIVRLGAGLYNLSPSTAEKIGLDRKDGLAKVEVRPLELPPPHRE
jgi:hypothetical protein